MAGDSTSDGQTFSSTVGLLYIFNLIVGTGALALPSAFQSAGYVLSVFLLFISAFTSYICATFILESLAIANCVQKRQQRLAAREEEFDDGIGDPSSGIDEHVSSAVNQSFDANALDFSITKRVELSQMAHMFLGRLGTLFAYFMLIVYLFGDLAVYSATVPKSLMNVLCSSLNSSTSLANLSAPCHTHDHDWLHSLTRFGVYRVCVIFFVLFCLPMVLMGMTKTKWLQLATTLSRWTAFLLMILMASLQLLQTGPKGSPSVANPHGFGPLFGVAVYAFMCHHSIPGLVHPIREKSNLSAKFSLVYAVVFLFYCALSMTGSFAFAHVQDIYTINFLHDEQTGGFWNALVDYFLALFPVFVLTSSYIIVAITLCNNIRVLIALVFNGQIEPPENNTATAQRLTSINGQSDEHEALLGPDGSPADQPINFHCSSPRQSSPSSAPSLSPGAFLHKFGVPSLVVLLPALLSLFTDNVLFLASITGSFPGVGVQYVLPALLVLGARRALSFRVGYSASIPSELRSPFGHWLWPMLILCWSLFAVLVVFFNLWHF